MVDPGFGASAVLDELPEGVSLKLNLLTHGHFDHMAEAAAVKEATGARVGIHPADEPLLAHAREMAGMFGMPIEDTVEPDFHLTPDRPLQLGGNTIEVRHTPGHSPGGVTFVLPGDIAIVGDALFAGSIGRTDLPGANHGQLIEAINSQILSLPDNTRVLSGHGPETTVGTDKRTNPLLV